MNFECCDRSSTAPGTCEECYQAGRHEAAGRARPPLQQAAKPSKADIWCDRYWKVFVGEPKLPALPPNPSQRVLSQMATLTAIKSVIAIVEATGAALRAA
jgi:hypothetical protein